MAASTIFSQVAAVRAARFLRMRGLLRMRALLLAIALAPAAFVQTQHAIAASAERRPNADQLLVEVYKDLAADRLREAEAKADALVAAYPNFRLGQLIRGDLLMMHTRPVNGFGEASGAAPAAIRNLREEAMVRLKSLRERPDPNLLPRAILQLRDDQKFALIVDAKRSRLYVYQNVAGELKLVSDYYISQGKLGVNKLREGDQKTPIGVYQITSRLAGSRLPAFYGAGALPLDYPNDWDRVNGRSGSGIWLHGVSSESYSRPPLSSEGCVVMTNEDLGKLLGSIEIGKTPVLISDNVEFVTRQERDGERGMVNQLLDAWRTDAESGNPSRIGANYSAHFRADGGEDLRAWLSRHPDFVTGGAGLTYRLRNVTSFLYPGRQQMLVTTFTQEAIARKGVAAPPAVRKRQYWAFEGARWKIVSESLI